MIGDFLKCKKLIGADEYPHIEDGTPIAVCNGNAPFWQFGIYCKGKVIIRQYDYKKNLTKYKFEDFNLFHGNFRYPLFEYVPQLFTYNKKETLSRARTVDVTKVFKGYLSVFGDDFVFWCMVGDNFWLYFTNSKMGSHYRMRYKEWNLISLYHHAIAIEQDCIVHFTSDRDPNNETHIHIAPFSDLKNPLVVEYDNDNLLQRYITRNRALWVWGSGGDLGGYNILTNNCEHLATWCRTGNFKSSQVRTALADIAFIPLLYFTPKAAPFIYNRFKKYFK